MTTNQLIYEIIVDENLKNIGAYYENLVEEDQIKVEEAIVLYLQNFSKALIKLECSIPKNLYNIIDARMLIASKIDKEMKGRIDQCVHLYLPI